MTNSVKHTYYFPQGPEQVWEYLTRSDLMELWLMPNNFLPIQGHEFEFRIKPVPALDFDGIVYCKVLDIEAFHTLSYSWKTGPGNGKIELDSIVTWKLIPKDMATDLILEHTGFRDIADLKMFSAVNDGWLANIKKMASHLNDAKRETTKP